MGRLANKVAIVTGAASGVGEATALLFAREGASVVVADLHAAGAERVAALIREAGGEALSFEIDVSDRARIDACFAATIARFGRLDVLVNNAGMSSAQAASSDDDPWDKGVSTTLSSVYWMSKAAIPHLTETRGAIVNVSSLAGSEMGTPVIWYCGAKAGVRGVTRSFATTYGKLGIRTNAVCPGAVDTPRIRVILDSMPGQEEIHNARSPLGRMAQASEIASVALFLASDDASYVNGHALVADGGFSIAG